MDWPLLAASWNPNKYHTLREISIWRVVIAVLIGTVLCAVAFVLLLLPGFFDANENIVAAARTTNITLAASMSQTAPTYLVRNPDIVLTTGEDAGFITITPTGLTVKKYLYFGSETYSWQPFRTLATFPASELLVPILVFAIPSLVLWTALFLLANAFLACVLYTMIAYFILHARNFRISYTDLWKVSLLASLPAAMIFAATPILRYGLPLAIVAGFAFVLWLVLALLGTALFAEKHVPKFTAPKTKK